MNAVAKLATRPMTLLQLVAATYFMVAGGPYGLEELMGAAGYSGDADRLELTDGVDGR